MIKSSVQKQFGTNAHAYLNSQVHAKGPSLLRLLELLEPQPSWRVLDIATGAGHTSFAFAPHVGQIVAADMTLEMLQLTAIESQARKLDNIILTAADAEKLPFIDGYFHLILCRIAAHHFPEVDAFVRGCIRCLKPGGKLAIVDNIVPESRPHAKRNRRKMDVGRYVNALERLRDPSHERCLSLVEWQQIFIDAGLTIMHQELLTKVINFDSWADRMNVSLGNRLRLQAMIQQAPEDVRQFLMPEKSGVQLTFALSEAILIGAIADS